MNKNDQNEPCPRRADEGPQAPFAAPTGASPRAGSTGALTDDPPPLMKNVIRIVAQGVLRSTGDCDQDGTRRWASGPKPREHDVRRGGAAEDKPKADERQVAKGRLSRRGSPTPSRLRPERSKHVISAVPRGSNEDPRLYVRRTDVCRYRAREEATPEALAPRRRRSRPRRDRCMAAQRREAARSESDDARHRRGYLHDVGTNPQGLKKAAGAVADVFGDEMTLDRHRNIEKSSE